MSRLITNGSTSYEVSMNRIFGGEMGLKSSIKNRVWNLWNESDESRFGSWWKLTRGDKFQDTLFDVLFE